MSSESREKLVWGRELYIDSTQVNANADLDSLTPRFAVEARAALQTHLAALFSEEESQQEPQQAATEVVAASIDATFTESMMSAMLTPLPTLLSNAEQEELAQDNAAWKVFFCYAHEDEELLNKLKTHLKPLLRQELIETWHDREILPETDWVREINGQLNIAHIILLLVSPDFMASDYC